MTAKACLAIFVIIAVAGLGSGLAAAADPPALDLTLGVSTDDTAPIQTSAHLSGSLTDLVGYRIGGWLTTGSGDSHGFLGDAYLDFKGPGIYAAGGQKFVVFGPAGGVLVSPGIRGGELKVDLSRVRLQVISGRTEFTPVTGGGPRISPGFPLGTVRPEEDMTAARVEFTLTPLTALLPLRVGVNFLDTLDEEGFSGDAELPLLPKVTAFGEYARFDSVGAWAAGVRFNDLRKVFGTSRATSAMLLVRDIPDGYAPAAVGATQYFPNQDGLAGGIYHELRPAGMGIGIWGDDEDAIITLFKHVPLG